MDDEIRWHLLMTKTYERRISRAFTLLREQGIEPLLIKGWAAARFYPPDKPRFFGDVDIAVSSSDYERASKMAASADLAFLAIDLHRELRALDTLPWKDIVDHSDLIETDNGSIRVPCPEDHLRVLCVHWLTDGGAYREKLWDIYYLIDNRRPGFDWNRAVGAVSPTRQVWIKTTIAIAHKYLGLRIDDLPFEREVSSVPTWIDRTLQKEWSTTTRLKPINTVLHDRRKLWDQIKKRIPPNPIQSTIEMEGRLDSRRRLYYQTANYFQRFAPMMRRIAFALSRTKENAG